MSSVRERLLVLFEKRRQVPGSDFAESHFLDYFRPNPENRKEIYHLTYNGRGRYYGFFEDVEQEFAICFSNKDYEANYSLDRYVARVEKLLESTQASLASLKNRMRADHGEKVMFFGTIFGCGLLAFFLKHQDWGLYAMGGFVVLFNGLILVGRARAKASEARLLAKIEARKGRSD